MADNLSSSPSRFALLRPETLGRMDVLENIVFEDILAARMARIRAVWAGYDPPNAAQYDVDGLEFDPIKIVEECNAYFEILLRDRVNQAARAVTLAFGFGTNLDAIATRYPGGVPRLDGESDDRYRRRVWASVNPLSPHGTAEAYEFWALSALASLRDARAVKVRVSLVDNPLLIIACLADSGGAWTVESVVIGGVTSSMLATRATDPAPAREDLLAIRTYIQDESRLAMTDEVTISAPKVTEADYRVQIDLFPGIGQQATMQAVMTALQNLVETQRWLGYDHTRAAISTVSMITGVHNVAVVTPATDLFVDNDWFVRVNSILLEYTGRSE